jgi:hypothetical protein
MMPEDFDTLLRQIREKSTPILDRFPPDYKTTGNSEAELVERIEELEAQVTRLQHYAEGLTDFIKEEYPADMARSIIRQAMNEHIWPYDLTPLSPES